MGMHEAAVYAALWCAGVSALLFALMGADKARAKKSARRVPEKRLFILALIGGAAGGWIGMYVFHHKTRHWYFKIGFPAIALLQGAALAYMRIG